MDGLIEGFLILLLIIIIIGFTMMMQKNDILTIKTLTDLWIKEVTQNKNPESIYKLFCRDGILIGTVSQSERKKRDIKKYFDYFARLPELRVLSKFYSVTRITDNVYVNNALITWMWKGLKDPVIARMTFIYRNRCLFELHSSKLPDLNKDLKKIIGVS